jgi:acyl-CoA dehydrogenase
MIIRRNTAALGFSALAHHKVIQKLASVSSVVSSTVGVPNSLGPGELLVHYGTGQGPDTCRAWPMAAKCRASLTGPFAGSDATSIRIVCKGEWNGEQVLGVKPDLRQALHHPGPGRFADRPGLPHVRSGWPARRHRDIGITLGLLPRDTAGVEIGRRHFR